MICIQEFANARLEKPARSVTKIIRLEIIIQIIRQLSARFLDTDDNQRGIGSLSIRARTYLIDGDP